MPAEVYATLLDEGVFLCSIRTMYRILSDAQEVRERRNPLRHPNYQKPELLATGPNQVWSWDITKLLGPAKWTYFYLYVILDIFSRYVVGWMIASRESADLAKRLIRESVEKQDVLEDQLTIHSDRGPSMKSHGVAQLLAALGITKSHSRPHMSNDNPFSESQFKTLKYRPDFPNRFGSQEDARDFCQGFFTWYNQEHYHSGIGLLTPASVHYGNADAILAKRQAVLDAAYTRRPERFVNKAPSPPEGPNAVWINPPQGTMETSNGDQSPLFEIQTPFGLIAPKSELEISRLTSAEASPRPQIPPREILAINRRNHGPAHPSTLEAIPIGRKIAAVAGSATTARSPSSRVPSAAIRRISPAAPSTTRGGVPPSGTAPSAETRRRKGVASATISTAPRRSINRSSREILG